MGKLKCDKDLFRKLAAEFVGTAMLLTLACTQSGPKYSGITKEISNWIEWKNDISQYSFTWGLVIVAIIHTFAFLSGSHINPVVSIAATIMGHMDWALMLVYICMHFLGAFVGYGLAYAAVPKNSGLFCVNYSGGGYKEWKMLLVEFMLTSVLALTVCAVWDRRSRDAYDSVSLRIGLIVAGLMYAGYMYTGTSLNFARTLAPSLIQMEFHGIWTYFVGQVLAAILMPLLWRFVLSSKEDQESQSSILGASA